MQELKALVTEIPDFPKPGILFRDISPLLRHHFDGTIGALDALFREDEWAAVDGRRRRTQSSPVVEVFKRLRGFLSEDIYLLDAQPRTWTLGPPGSSTIPALRRASCRRFGSSRPLIAAASYCTGSTRIADTNSPTPTPARASWCPAVR